MYLEDLKHLYLWSLLGLHQALKQQEKNKEAESVHALILFQKANACADITVGASCLCATIDSRVRFTPRCWYAITVQVRHYSRPLTHDHNLSHIINDGRALN